MYKYIHVIVLVLFCSSLGADDKLAAADAEADRVHPNGKNALMVAAKNGDNDRVMDLIGRGADVNQPNSNGGTPIMYAVLSGKPDTVSLLLSHDAQVNAVARNGWTALMIASVKGYTDIARLLLENGAEPNQMDVYSWTPLMRAVYEERLPIAKLLVDNDATEVNRRGENGVTALHLAVMTGEADAVKLLLARGAHPDIEDDMGRTAMDFARQNNNLDLLRIMRAGYSE
jgi:uncharacterized protein